MNFNDQLRRARRQARLTQPQLAALIGVSHSAIDGWERGAWRPRPEHREALLTVLGPFDGDAEIAMAAALEATTSAVKGALSLLAEEEPGP